jgi:RimJ/RimL family protein N-acetyltransferase
MQWSLPQLCTHHGAHVTLEPLDAHRDGQDLYAAGHATSRHLYTWQYLPYGPFATHEDFGNWLTVQQQSVDPLFHTVRDVCTARAVGLIAIMNIAAQHGRAELGHIWYDVNVQRSVITAETAHLLLSYLFDTLNYRRVEWKCDNRNVRSKAAALRLGFCFEGLFRQHLVVKQQNRDTAWFAITDAEWPTIRERQRADLTRIRS